MAQQQKDKRHRRGEVFSLRLTREERLTIELEMQRIGGPKGVGPWLVWRGLSDAGLSARSGNTKIERRVILDLCGGSGAWSEPYRAAGYDVRLVTLPEHDVRLYVPPDDVWGVLAAPPCTEFSIAKNGRERDLVGGMECVNACMRIILQCRPKWWALENPSGLLSKFIGTARDYFEPYEFGDPWTKPTCLWGSFELPKRGPFVDALGPHPEAGNAAQWAVTPAGFARAFHEANP